jgi:alkanesulfonate monooxygenase SsuD/methylene tetrahydromethanopterin reductase-like flavin-dependent oxidoreductase (luciferase family)
MRFALMTEPQQGLQLRRDPGHRPTAEEAGFEAFFRSDHYASFPGDSGQPTTDAWATLAGLARETTRINLGVLVSPVTFRPPGNFAKVVTTVAEMSGGRVEVGLGAGWNEASSTASTAWPSRPPASASTCSRSSWPSCTGCGPSPTAGATAVRHWQVAMRSSTPSQRHRRTTPSEPARRWRRWAAHGAPGGALRRRAQHLVGRAGKGERGLRAAGRCLPRSGATPPR